MFNKDLTIIITASYIPSHPSIRLIKEVIDSLSLINHPPDTRIILAHDYSAEPDYQKYLENLRKEYGSNPYIEIVVRPNHGHLVGNIRYALKKVKSEFLLVIQHDLKFNKRPIEIMKVIADMRAHPFMKHIRFNKRPNRKESCDSHFDLFGKQIKAKNYTYTRTNAWSDNNHICPTEYYNRIVMKECKNGKPMEYFLLLASKDEETHKIYGTYIFGPVEDRSYIKHLDGKHSQ